MTWKDTEEKGLKFIKDNYDSNAYLQGGSNAYEEDLICPTLNYIVEIKQRYAQCGQFTESTANTEIKKEILNKRRQDVTSEDAKNFVKEHYLNKGVTHFLIEDNEEFTLYSFDDFFETFNFSLENRQTKKSGSRSLPKKDIPYIPEEWHATKIDNTYYVLDSNLWDTCYEYFNANNQIRVISPTARTNGQIRVLSNTNNPTWIFKID